MKKFLGWLGIVADCGIFSYWFFGKFFLALGSPRGATFGEFLVGIGMFIVVGVVALYMATGKME